MGKPPCVGVPPPPVLQASMYPDPDPDPSIAVGEVESSLLDVGTGIPPSPPVLFFLPAAVDSSLSSALILSTEEKRGSVSLAAG